VTQRKREREREREKKVEGGSERHYRVGGGMSFKHNLAVWKVPRQCPLVLLVKARLVFGICSILILKMFERL
jgi:hypothetical protein